MGALDSVVFGKKKFSSILEEIYNNQNKKSKQISGLISEQEKAELMEELDKLNTNFEDKKDGK